MDASLLAFMMGSGLPAGDAPDAPPAQVQRFGAEGSWRANLLGGVTADFDGAEAAQLLVGFSWFFLDDVSMDFQLELDGIAQPGPDAVAGGVDLLFRWHFYSAPTWTIYMDGGCGVLGSSQPVPQGGSQFNFTPQIGVGATIELDHSTGTRLMVGARWYHISNARLGSSNPGRDSIQLYAGITIPF